MKVPCQPIRAVTAAPSPEVIHIAALPATRTAIVLGVRVEIPVKEQKR